MAKSNNKPKANTAAKPAKVAVVQDKVADKGSGELAVSALAFYRFDDLNTVVTRLEEITTDASNAATPRCATLDLNIEIAMLERACCDLLHLIERLEQEGVETPEIG